MALEADARYDPFDTGWSPRLEAVAHLLAGRFDRSVEIFTALAAQPGASGVLGKVGLLVVLSLPALQTAGRAEEARAIAEDTLAAARADGNPSASLRAFRVRACLRPADPARALLSSGRGWPTPRSTGSPIGKRCSPDAAALEALHGDAGQALGLFDTAIDSFYRRQRHQPGREPRIPGRVLRPHRPARHRRHPLRRHHQPQ